MRVFEWLVILVGCKIYGIKELEASESKKSLLVGDHYNSKDFTLKPPRRKTCFHSLNTISKIWLR